MREEWKSLTQSREDAKGWLAILGWLEMVALRRVFYHRGDREEEDFAQRRKVLRTRKGRRIVARMRGLVG